MFRRFFNLLFFVFVVNTAYGQNELKTDSLRRLIGQGEISTEQEMSVLYWLSAYSDSPTDVLRYGNALLAIAEKNRSVEFIAKAYTNIGIGHRLMGDLEDALKFQFLAASTVQADDRYLNLVAEIYAEISNCYTQNGDSENALLYGSKTIAILRRVGGKQQLALTLLNTGYDYYLTTRYDSAMAYYNEAEPILQDIGMDIGLAYIIGNRALIYWKRNNITRAKTDLFKAIQLLEPLGDTYGMADYYNQLGNIFLEEGNDLEAIKYTKKGLELAKSEGLKEQVRDASFILYRLHQRQKNYESALAYQSDYFAFRDSIQNVKTTQELANLRTEYEVGRKQAEVDFLTSEKEKNQVIIVIGSILLVVFIILLIIVYSFLKTKNRLNTQLQEQKDSLQILNQTKDKFFSIISHDLRGPVHTLSGLVTISRIYMRKGTPEQSMEMIDKMDQSIGSLTKLLNNLLTWALNQRGHFPYMPEEISMRFMLDDMSSLFEEMATSKGIKLSYDIEEELKLYVDRNTTSTILRNLVTNSIKFTQESGGVSIKAYVDGDKAKIEVSDTGVGMSKESLQQLFKLNEKLSTKGTSGETGLGLGLQLVYDFVKLNKGTIEVNSEVDKGTTFIVSLPKA